MKKHIVGSSLTPEENRLIEQLRQHPEIRERVRSILEIAGNEEGPLKTADPVETLLIDERRRLGNVTMRQWASQAEERVPPELKRQTSTVLLSNCFVSRFHFVVYHCLPQPACSSGTRSKPSSLAWRSRRMILFFRTRSSYLSGSGSWYSSPIVSRW